MLALLVSTLLVGRQIIDRAKVQQVVSEIDYYTKNFQMFRDQYEFLPGALGVENCRKYPEFSLQKGDELTQYDSQCDDPTSQKALLSANDYYTSYKQANFSMVDMVVSGMVENRSPGDRRRKKFDIAEKQETTCVELPVVRSNYGLLDENSADRDIDNTMFGSRGGYNHISGSGENIMIYYEVCFNDYAAFNESSCNYCYIDCCVDRKLDSVARGTYRQLVCRKSHCGGSIVSGATATVIGGSYDGKAKWWTYSCSAGGTAGTNGIIPYGYLKDTYIKLTDIAMEKYQNKKKKVCETKTIPGEPRLGYLLKQDEIENQANKSSFDSKTWISYSGGKVDKAMIYGFGDSTLAGAVNDSAIVFFHHDPDKTEVTDDGAVSYTLYDLIVRKLGEKTDGVATGNIIPFSKTSGQGFNFGYIMR